MAHAQKPDFVFQRKGRVYLNRQGPLFSRLLAAVVCVSAVVMPDTSCSEEVWRVLATHSIRQFPIHFPPMPHRVPSHFNLTVPKSVPVSRPVRSTPQFLSSPLHTVPPLYAIHVSNPSYLTHWRRVTQICVFTLQLSKTDDANLRF